MRNIAIIPARCGSKGIKDKNIKSLNGKPLLEYTIIEAKKSKIFDCIFVSTDSEKYANLSVQLGAQVPFLRSAELANDSISTWDAVKEVVKNYKTMGIEFDNIFLLQPTSPLRTSEDILNGYNLFLKEDAKSVIGLCKVDHSPLWCNTLPSDNCLDKFINKEILESGRQSLEQYYRINGALYILKEDALNSIESIYNNNCYGLIMDRENSIDIDEMLDFEIAEFLLGRRNSDDN